MKKNLFLLHTQYNIILGTSVVLSRFRDYQNDLVVYAEFALSDEYKSHLESAFNHVLYIRDRFEPRPKGFWNEERNLYGEYKKFKNSEMYGQYYENVFISQDRPLEHLILGSCKIKNPRIKCYDIEEGCYYSLKPENNDPNRKREYHAKRNLIFRKLWYGRTYFTEEYKSPIDGEASYFNGIYAIFPKCIRTELKEKTPYEITTKEIVEAVNLLYSEKSLSIPESSRYVLFFFDLLNRYNNPEAIKRIVGDIINKAEANGSIVLLKYHPRETDKFHINGDDNIIEIPCIIPAEKLLCDLYGKDVTVYGNATTSILVAQKLGFHTVSVAGIEGSDNKYMINKLKQIGINVPSGNL